MTVYKYFFKITWNNKFAILLYFALFLVTVILNSSSMGDTETDFSDIRLSVGIIDNENSKLSNGLIDYIKSRNDIVDTKEDEVYIKEQIFMESAHGVLIIPEGFDEDTLGKKESVIVYTDDRRPESMQLENQINKYLSFANIAYQGDEYMLDDVEEALTETVQVNFIDKQGESNKNAIKWANFYFNFTGYAIVAIYIMAIGLVMSEINNKKVALRRRISSKRFLNYNIEILLGQLSIAVATVAVFIIGFIVWKGDLIGLIDFEKYIVNIVVFSTSILSLTFLVTNLTNNRYAIMALATVLSLGTSFISGVMVPQEYLGEKVLNIAKFFPVYHFVKANNTNISSYGEIRNELLIMILFAVAFLLLGLIVSKRSQRMNVSRVKSNMRQ
ncbi:MAG: ABC transporter permease [Tissierellaceae bacterium]|jgi:ABC-2 type transport system permease protein